jgi:hypothetical protein
LVHVEGAPFQWAAIFHKEDIKFTKGHDEMASYNTSEKLAKYKLPCKIGCSYCRTPILDEGRNMILLFRPFQREPSRHEEFRAQVSAPLKK